jgi:hypothetical protein
VKYSVTWLEEKTTEIDATDLGEAERYSVAMIGRLGGFPGARLLSIHEIKLNAPKDDKPPTPFGNPPSGTLGGGQMKVAEGLPDAIAAAA